MTLTLTIRNVDRLDNGMPAQFVLHRRGAMIGRSPTCDWSLPDPRNYISSRHCEVVFRDGFYLLSDVSTNGTFLNGAGEKMAAPRRIDQGDRFQVGQYEVVASLSGEAVAAIERHEEASAQAAQAGGWNGWDGGGAAAPPAIPAAPSNGWDSTPPIVSSAAGSGWGPSPAAGTGSNWGPPPVDNRSSGWGPPPDTGAPAAQSWAPRTGPSLARDAAHVAHARGGDAAPLGAASLGGDWTPSARVPDPPVVSAWEQAIPAQAGASPWSSAAPDRPPAALPDDVWGKIADGNVVDWARGGFGQPVEHARDPLGIDKPPAREALPKPQPRMAQFDVPAVALAGPPRHASPAVASPTDTGRNIPAALPDGPRTIPPVVVAPSPAASEAAAARPLPAASGAPAAPGSVDPMQLVNALTAAAGLAPGQLKAAGPDTLTRAGQLLKQLVSGLVVMVEARARAKSQMGAEATSLEFDGNNPIKFARTPEQAVAQLLNPKERGFMEADRAIEDAFYDLQSHQMATLKAMQGALRATLDRFSPTAIRKRADTGGLLAKIMPGAKEAALWQAYEREFGGVAQGSDEAFMDVFAKEFRRAYEDQTNARRAARR